MGRRPKQESVKEFLHNKKTRFLFSDAAEYANIFPEGKTEMYLKPVPAGGRMKKGHFQIIGHFPNSESNNREDFVQQKEQGSLGRFMKGDMKAKRYRWDAGSYSGFHLILHDQKGKRQEFMLRSLGDKRKGALVFAQMAVPSEKDRRLFVCPVNVGFFGPSASRSGEFKLTMAKPKAECTPGLVKDGHAPAAYEKVYKSKKKGKTAVKAAETLDEEGFGYFYESQGYSYDAEHYMAETATYEPSNEPDMASPATEPTNANFSAEEIAYAVSWEGKDDNNGLIYGIEYTDEDGGVADAEWFSTADERDDELAQYLEKYGAEKVRMCASCGSYKKAEGHGCGCMGAESQEFTFAYAVHDKNTGEEIGDGEVTVTASNKREARGEAMRMLEEGGLDDEEFHLHAESESATYEPSSEPDMVSPATEPTNANFEAQGAYPSLEDFTGTESVVVEPPLGHGVAQWYAETATYEPSSEPDMESPATEPTNATFNAYGDKISDRQEYLIGKLGGKADKSMTRSEASYYIKDLMEAEEMSPSSFDIRWEDMEGVSSPSLPPEGIHFAEETEEAFGSVGEGNNFGQMRAEHESDFVVEKPFKTAAFASAGVMTGLALFGIAGTLAMGLLGKIMDKEE